MEAQDWVQVYKTGTSLFWSNLEIDHKVGWSCKSSNDILYTWYYDVSATKAGLVMLKLDSKTETIQIQS